MTVVLAAHIAIFAGLLANLLYAGVTLVSEWRRLKRKQWLRQRNLPAMLSAQAATTALAADADLDMFSAARIVTNTDTVELIDRSGTRHVRAFSPPLRTFSQAKADCPPRTVCLMATADAERYSAEWGAHLLQLVEEGEVKQARTDRRRLALAAVALALVLRLRRFLR